MNTSNALARAVELAKRGPAHGPNPRVGAVLLRDGVVIGEGWHKGAGTPHAEADAIENALQNGNTVTGAQLIVTLEPCNHHGRTPPCTDLILAAGISKVIYASPDPGTKSGGGAQYLNSNGIPTAQLENKAATELARIWAFAITQGRPYVTVKLATSLDGRIAAQDGASQWITGAQSRQHAHQIRSQVDAILVTTGTVLADNAALTARDANGDLYAHQPLRVIIGKRSIPADARIIQTGDPANVLQYHTHDISDVLAKLGQLEVRHVLVEGGPALLTACFTAGVVDEVNAYIAPVVIGAGKTAVHDYGATTLSAAARFATKSVQRLGDDVLLIAQKT